MVTEAIGMKPEIICLWSELVLDIHIALLCTAHLFTTNTVAYPYGKAALQLDTGDLLTNDRQYHYRLSPRITQLNHRYRTYSENRLGNVQENLAQIAGKKSS